ncbi:hypothetical protein [Psychrobacillus sp. MER TA 171]|uniref:hypothetical protein n=1 Tax=Psychrobacillus sp. MER TA 171 TaxID=2939577 RepID=UPI00203F6EFC|nr:hypothetical protein [Psychrobacillus sp. MER TA 171]MCM3359814.1 hypothetical protein [Psychrobacillus sp. MER TA 171]
MSSFEQLIERLRVNEIARDKSLDRLLAALKTMDDTEIHIALSEVLSWIANTHEWHNVRTMEA